MPVKRFFFTASKTCIRCETEFVPAPRFYAQQVYCTHKCFLARSRIPLAEKLRRTGWDVDENGCWIWRGKKLKSGYGTIPDGQKKAMAHRVAYEEKYGPIPDGMLGCHRCDNPPCVNPDHVFPGTNQDNSDDKLAKGRGNLPFGALIPGAKLNDELVLDIRSLPKRFGDKRLAKIYGVSKSTIDAVRRRITWVHLP